MKRYKVYVAGPYSDTNVLGVLRNIGRGQYYACQLFQEGFAPFVPWFDKEFVIQEWSSEFDVKDFYDYSMEWLKVSDAVFVVPDFKGMKRHRDSGGVQAELEAAKEQGIPIFYNVIELIKWFKRKDDTKN